MAREPWTTPPQKEFLQARIGKYKEAQRLQYYIDFWAELFEEWEKVFPKIEEIFPGKELKDLTPDENEKLKHGLQERRGQLQTWYRWRFNKRARGAEQVQTKLDKELFNPRTRVPHKAEVYSKMCYEEKIKPVVQARLDEKKTTSRGDKLRVIRAVTREMLEKEDPEVKAKVDSVFSNLHAKRDAALPTARTPAEYSKSIQESPALLGRFLSALAEKTGWAYTVLMGGPEPGSGGDINVASFHVGESSTGRTFGQAHSTFETAYMDPYTQFLHQIYPLHVRKMRSLAQTEGGAETGGKGDLPMGGSGFDMCDDVSAPSTCAPPIVTSASVLTVTDTPPIGTVTSAAVVSAPPTIDMPPSIVDASPAVNISTDTYAPLAIDASPSIVNAPPSVVNAPPSVVNAPPSVVNAPPAVIDAPPFIVDAPPTVVDALPSVIDAPQPTLTNAPPAATQSVSASPTPAPYGFGVMAAPEPALAASSFFDLPPTTVYNQGFDLGLGSYNLQSTSTPDFQAGGWPIGRGFAGEYNQESWGGTTGSLMSELEGGLDIGPYPNLDFLSPPPVTFDIGAYAPSPPPSTLSIMSGSTPSLRLDAFPTSPTVPPPSSPPVPQPLAVSRHSGRAIVPSTRAKQMNEIGSTKSAVTNDTPNSNKENHPPGSIVEPPAWILAAETYLTSLDLGKDWSECIKAWRAFEFHLGYAHKKSAMPSLDLRPEEWASWIAKGRGGVRPYEHMPAITSPLEFGTTVMKWWCAIQPAFRQSADSPMPAAIYDDPNDTNCWEGLRRGGPNGMVSVLTLLAWWGQSRKKASQWEEDSETRWLACVVDVRRVFERLVSGHKRAALDTSGVFTKKIKA